MVMLTIWPAHVGRQINQFTSLFNSPCVKMNKKWSPAAGKQWWVSQWWCQKTVIEVKAQQSQILWSERQSRGEGAFECESVRRERLRGKEKREKVSKRNQQLLLRPTGRRSRARWCKQEVEKRAWSHGRARYCDHTHVRHLHADKCKTLLQDSPTFPCRVGMQPRLKACSRWDASFKGFNSNADQIKTCIIMIKTPYCEAATLSLAASQGRQSAGVEH